jgi:general secretion pathway protein D
MSLLKQITVVLLCSSVLVACNTPPKRKARISAQELAKRELQTQPPVVNKVAVDQPVAEPPPPPEPLKKVNQIGRVPTVTTLTEQTLDISNLSNDAPIELDFEQVALRQIIELIADALNISVVIDPTIGNKITIRTAKDKPLTKKDLWPLLQMLLNDAGVTMEKKGKVYYLKKAAPKLPGTMGITPETLTSSTSPEVLQITPLRYITAEAAQTVINPLIQPKGRVITLPTLNVIGIITTPERLKRVNKLLHIIDADPFLHRGMRLFRLINSKATEVQAELDKILKAIYNKATPAYQVIALERINAILVVAPPNSGFNEVATWVEILDERSEESGEQVFIYKVKNLEASKLASTLSSVFKLDKEAEEKQKLKKTQQKAFPTDNKNKKKNEKPPSSPTPNGSKTVSADLKVTIVADESTNSLLIRASARDYRQLLETIYTLDQVPKEVMINVVLAEVKLTEATQFGIDWHALFKGAHGAIGSDLTVPDGNFATSINSTTSSDTTSSNTNIGETKASDTSDNNTSSLASFAGLTINYLSGGLNAVLNMVASNNELSILSRPSLLVRNNEEASINIGSNEPFLSTVNTSSTNPSDLLSTDVQYKDTGITVKVTPRINDDGIINLKIFQELSQLGEERTTQNLQSFITRKIETFVVVRDGSTIVIGGLIQTIERDNQQGIPLLKDIPLIGRTLFSSTDKQVERTELALIIVPQIVNPEADNRPLVLQFKKRLELVSKLLNERQVFMGEWAVPPSH